MTSLHQALRAAIKSCLGRVTKAKLDTIMDAVSRAWWEADADVADPPRDPNHIAGGPIPDPAGRFLLIMRDELVSGGWIQRAPTRTLEKLDEEWTAYSNAANRLNGPIPTPPGITYDQSWEVRSELAKRRAEQPA